MNSSESKKIYPNQSLYWLVPLLAFSSSGLTWWRTKDEFFWQDDFVFLIQANRLPLGWDLFSTPLFSHFSPVAWSFHALVARTGMSWALAQSLMFLVVGLGALAVGHLSLIAGCSRLTSCVVASGYGASVIHLRSMSWWSAFVQDMPLVPLLLTGLGFWCLALRRTTWWAVVGTLLFCLLSGLAYEPGYLYPIFMSAMAALLHVTGIQLTSSRRVIIATFIASTVISTTLFLHHRFNYAVVGPDQSFVDVLRLTVTFIGGSTGPLLLGRQPSTTWPAVFTGFFLVLLPFVFAIFVLRKKGLALAISWSIPYFLLAGALAYARAGFDTKTGVPGYPRDYQYHGLSTAWTILFLGILVEQVSRSRSRFKPGRFAVLLLLFPVVLIPPPNVVARVVSMTQENPTITRQFAASLDDIAGGTEYAIDRPIPGVIEQFGEYARLFSAREILSSDAAVLGGATPVWIDDRGLAQRTTVDRTLESTVLDVEVSERCIQPRDNWARLVIEPVEAGTIVEIEMKVHGQKDNIEVTALLGSDGTQTWRLGTIDPSATSLAFQTPRTFSDRTTASALPLFAVQFGGLTARMRICFGDASILRVS